MKNPWIIPAATLVVGAIGGFISGKGTSSSEVAATTAESASARPKASSRSAAGADDESKQRTARAKSVGEAFNTPGHSARVKALIDFYSGLTPEQLAEESKKLENLPMNERMMASFLLFGRWAEVDPMAAMAQSNSMGMAGMFVRPTILQSWASVDPENAAKYYSENPREFGMMGGMGGPGGGQNGASTIASEWAKQDPQGALAWASTLEGRDKTQAMTSVIREVAMTDPKKAAELAATMPADERGDAYRSIAQRWGSSNFAEAESWVKSLPADQQAAAMASAIAGLSQDNPLLASTKINSMADGDEKNRATRSLVENWSKQDPKAAAAYLMAQNNADVQDGAIRDVITNWTGRDNAAALSFIKSQPAGKVYDNAVSSYVMSDRSSDPADLMAVAETIGDEGDRGRTMGMAAMRWMREDVTSAKSYIQQSTAISDNMKERLLSGRGGFGGPGGPRGQR